MVPSDREPALRIAWTLYQVDSDISRSTGRPSSIDEASWHPIMPSEIFASSGIYDPWGLTDCLVSFNMEHLRLSSSLSRLSNSKNQKVLCEGINNCVASLQRWYEGVPPHLQWNVPVPSPHKRPICLLHLRYWSAIISSTRSILLRDVQCIDISLENEEPELSTIGRLCMDACERSLQILEEMHSSDVLSSLTIADTKHLVDVATIFFLICIPCPKGIPQQRLDRCIELLQSMESIGWCKFSTQGLMNMVGRYRSWLCNRRQSIPAPAAMQVELQSLSGPASVYVKIHRSSLSRSQLDTDAEIAPSNSQISDLTSYGPKMDRCRLGVLPQGIYVRS